MKKPEVMTQAVVPPGNHSLAHTRPAVKQKWCAGVWLSKDTIILCSIFTNSFNKT